MDKTSGLQYTEENPCWYGQIKSAAREAKIKYEAIIENLLHENKVLKARLAKYESVLPAEVEE